jgi:hypothetical protein
LLKPTGGDKPETWLQWAASSAGADVAEVWCRHRDAGRIDRHRRWTTRSATALDRNQLGALLMAAALGSAQKHALISLLA